MLGLRGFRGRGIGSPGLVAPQKVTRVPGLPRFDWRRGFGWLLWLLGRCLSAGLLLEKNIGPRLDQIQGDLARGTQDRGALLKQFLPDLIAHIALWTYRFHRRNPLKPAPKRPPKGRKKHKSYRLADARKNENHDHA